MRRLRLAPALVVGAALLITRNSCPALAAPVDHQLAIGVVSTSRVLRAMGEFKKLQADFRTQNMGLAQQQRQKEQEIQQLQDHRDANLKPGSQQWKDETDATDKKRVELEVWKQMSTIQLERVEKESLKICYDHIADAAAQVAEQEHLDLVISDPFRDIGPDMDKATAAQLDAALSSRVVLFSNKKADITEDVLTVVEANFAKQQGGPPVGPRTLPAPGSK